MIDKSFIEAIQETSSALEGVQFDEMVRPHAVLGNNYKIQAVPDEMLKDPWHFQQGVSVYDALSFCTYFADFSNESSRIFVDRDWQKPAILAVIDYHGKDKAQWTAHRVSYQFRQTAEWKTWAGKNKHSMKQSEFAEFIEENLPDIIDPPQADMLEISRTLEAMKSVEFSSGIRLSNGQSQLKYTETTRGTANNGALEVPEVFSIQIAPYEGSTPVKIGCRLRYRITDGILTIWYQLIRPHKVIEEAVASVVSDISNTLSEAKITFGSI